MISKADCELCDKLQELFDIIDVKYNIYKYNQDDDDELLSFKEKIKEMTGGKQFPFCYFNQEYVGGYKDIHKNLITGKLHDQLNAIGIEYEDDF